MKNRRIIFSACLLLIITATVFLPSLKNGFTNWDDGVYVVGNPRLKDLSWAGVKKLFTSCYSGDYYKPLTELSFAVEYRFFGLAPRIYHATNLVFHLLNCLLVFWLILLLSDKVGISFIVALLFGIHPLHVESVAWINQRKDVLYGFFFLGALVSYVYYLRRRVAKYYWLALILFFISLLPKPQGIMLPFVLILFDYFEGRGIDRKTFSEKTPFFLIAVVFVIISLVALEQSSPNRLNAEELLTPISSLMKTAYGLVFYLSRLLMPVRLSCFYPAPAEAGMPPPRFFIFSPLILTALITCVIFSGRYTRKIVFGSLFFLINIALVLQLISTRPTIVADHYTYIPSIGLFYLAGVFICWIYRGEKRYIGIIRLLVPIILGAAAGMLLLLTRQRCRVWKESETLWADAIKKYPNAYFAHNNLGEALVARNKQEEAVVYFKKALHFNPNYAKAHNNLGATLFRQGKFKEASFHFAEALQVNPDFAEAHNGRGLTLLKEKRLKEAVFHFTEVLRIKPGYIEAYYNLGTALDRQGKFQEAADRYRKALELKPEHAEAHNSLGVILAKRGDLKDAVFHFSQALKLKPDFSEARNNLKLARKEMGER